MPAARGPFREQLQHAMRKQGVSQRELARRLAEIDGTKPESKRRWISKLLNPEGVENPDAESVTEIETALELRRGYFKQSVPPQATRLDRLAALEADAHHRTAAGLAILRAMEVLLEQVVALGGTVPRETVQGLAEAAVHMRSGGPRPR